MDGRLGRSEALGMLGGLLLAVGVFLPWYATSATNRNADIDGARGTFSAWDVHPILRWLLLAAAVAPFILAYIIVRQRELSWPRGELTAVTSVAVIIMVIFLGVLDKPGTPRGEITVSYGWWLALAGGILILIGAVWRTSESTAARKPPGVL
jgi:hypothetical protein